MLRRVQNLQNFKWSEQEVNEKLDTGAPALNAAPTVRAVRPVRLPSGAQRRCPCLYGRTFSTNDACLQPTGPSLAPSQKRP